MAAARVARCAMLPASMRPRALFVASALFVVGAALSGCSRTDEPDGSARERRESVVAPLVYEVPATWTKVDKQDVVIEDTKKRKAVSASPVRGIYKLPKVGEDKEEAELQVMFPGLGKPGEPEPIVKEWLDSFDGKAGDTAVREKLEVGGIQIELIEVAGTWKVPLAPGVGPQKRAPVSMVKKGFRLLGAVVKVPQRGNWFFRLVGPDETVLAGKSGFRAMLEGVK